LNREAAAYWVPRFRGGRQAGEAAAIFYLIGGAYWIPPAFQS
jgi:hypothetical protein